MITFEELQTAAVAAGLEAKDCGGGHWQVRGPFIVNCYPYTKDGMSTIYVSKTNFRIKVKPKEMIQRAIEAAKKAPDRRPLNLKTDRPNNTRKKRAKLLKVKGNKCHWCPRLLTLDNSTIEHIVPLDRGGTNGWDNIVLACEQCNNFRGHDMPELTSNFGNYAKDPVVYIGPDDEVESGTGFDGPGWYYYDETWVYIQGPWATQEEARAKCIEYSDSLSKRP